MVLPIANSSMLVLPRMTAPAFSRFSTASALKVGIKFSKILEEQGYDTQILEFIDMEHTPKNLLIRAIHRKKQSDKKKEKAAQQVDAFCKQFGFTPTLWKLLQEEGEEGGTHDE